MTTLLRFALLFALLAPCLLSATPQAQSFRVAPSYFPNQGQVSDKSVTWYSRGANVSLYLRGTTLTYVLTHRPKSALDNLTNRHDMAETAAVVDRVDVELVGANPRYEIQAEAPQAGVFHFYLPQCSPGLRDVPHYGRVVCRDVWPGVDMVLGTQCEALKYDFVVKPGADAGQIRMRYGGQGPNLAPDGGLTRPTLAGVLRESAPTAWTTAPDGSRKPVTASWQLAEDGSPYFALGAYDAKEPLTIDPVVWGMYLGGSEDDRIYALCSAEDGGVFAGGFTTSTSFQGLRGDFKGWYDSFLMRFSPAGELIWGVCLGGVGGESINAICPAPDGGVFAGGHTGSNDFEGLNDSFKGGLIDGFLARFSASGDIVWGKYLGGNGVDIELEEILALCSAPDGGVFAGGYTELSDFEGLSGGYKGGRDGFLIRFSAIGDLVWGKYLGGSAWESVHALCPAPDGGVFAGGYTESGDFDGLSGGFRGGQGDGILMRISPEGDLIWGSYLGGSGIDEVSALCSAPSGGVFAGGKTGSTNFEGLDGTYKGGETDGFLLHISTGGDFIWGKYLGGRSSEQVYSLWHAPTGGMFVGGFTQSSDFEGLTGSYNGGEGDGFLMRFAALGDLIWGDYLGGNRWDEIRAICTNPSGDIFVGGYTGSRDFDGLSQSYHGGDYDGFLLKFSDPTSQEPPTVDAGPDLEICAGESAQLSAAISPAGDYRVVWTPAEGLDDPNSLSPTAAPAQTTQYVVTVLGAEPPVTDTVLVVLRQSPAIQAIDVSPVNCEDGTIALTLSGGEPPYSVFVNSALTGAETEPTFSISVAQAGLYEVRIEDAAGCSVEAEVEVPGIPALRFMVVSQKVRVQPDQADRVLIFNAIKGSPPVEYSVDGQNYQPLGVFFGLRAGPITIYARDEQGCVIQREIELK